MHCVKWLPNRFSFTFWNNTLVVLILFSLRRTSTFALSNDPRWHLQRIVQREALTSQQFNFGEREFNLSTIPINPTPVTIYVIDSGVRIQHEEFTSGRAVYGVNIVDPGEPPNDCNGHGTHVAALAAGAYSGVATQARIISVRVLDCEGIGSCSDIISALDWVADHFQSIAQNNSNARAVVVMSIGSSSESCDQTERASSLLWERGIIVAAAAGNQRTESCTIYPVRNNHTIGVGAIDKEDRIFEKNNYGNCVDIFAPGVNLLSAWGSGTNTELKWSTGTSMATPLVAGVAAIILAADPTLTSGDVKRILLLSSTLDTIRTSDGSLKMNESPNRLLYAPWARLFSEIEMDSSAATRVGIKNRFQSEIMADNSDWNSTTTFGALRIKLWPRTKPAMAYAVVRIKWAVSNSMAIGDRSILSRRAAGVTLLSDGSEPDVVDLVFYIPMTPNLVQEYRRRLVQGDESGILISQSKENITFANKSALNSFALNVTVPQSFTDVAQPVGTNDRSEIMAIIIAVTCALAVLIGFTLMGVFRHKIFQSNTGNRQRVAQRRNRTPVEDSDESF